MTRPLVRIALGVAVAVAAAIGLCAPAAASHLVTGNGFGIAVVAPESGTATRFYPHPYSFMRPDPADPLSEGIETPNFIGKLRWGTGTRAAATDYVDDTQVIRMRRSDGSGYVFMPFGLERPALIISWEAAPGRPGS